MVCRMPAVNLTDYLSQQLENSGSGMIDNIQGPGVAVYFSSDRNVRADIYIGLKLDGFTPYHNISSVHPEIKMQFAIQPELCSSDVVTFSPNSENDTISIQVYTFRLSVILSNLNRFSKFLHCWKAYEIC